MPIRPEPREVINELFDSKFRGAKVIFFAGSVACGEHTESSDLDLVVVFENLKSAWRESFKLNGWPIEAFVHDPSTLKYFFEEVDAPGGVPSLPRMVAEGVPFPKKTAFSNELKEMAQSVLDNGPPPWDRATIDNVRYLITDLIDDLRHPCNLAEATATGTRLYSALAEFHLRARGLWSASGKTIPRVLKQTSPHFEESFLAAFDQLFREGNPQPVIELAHRELRDYGGFLFDGYKINAPADWKKAD